MLKSSIAKRCLLMGTAPVVAVVLTACVSSEPPPIYATQADVERMREEIMRNTVANAEKLQSSEYSSRAVLGNIEELQFQVGDLQREIDRLENELAQLQSRSKPTTPQLGGAYGAANSTSTYPAAGTNTSVGAEIATYGTESGAQSANTTNGAYAGAIGGDNQVTISEISTDQGVVSGGNAIPQIGAENSSAGVGSSENTQTDAPVPAGGAVASDGVEVVTLGAESPEVIYQRAFEALRVGEVDNAIHDLNAIVNQYPQHDFADESLYWIGEAKYISNEFSASKSAFSRLINEYPGAPQYPDALLRLGLIAMDEGDSESALRYFNDVVSDYPQSRAGITAQNHLSQISTNGQN